MQGPPGPARPGLRVSLVSDASLTQSSQCPWHDPCLACQASGRGRAAAGPAGGGLFAWLALRSGRAKGWRPGVAAAVARRSHGSGYHGVVEGIEAAVPGPPWPSDGRPGDGRAATGLDVLAYYTNIYCMNLT